MGGPPGRQIFREGDLLANFIDYLRLNGPGRRALVINGDMVDFLAEDDPLYFDAEGAVRKLAAIRSRPEFAPVWTALTAFVATDECYLAVTLGNHDLELALPWVRECFLDLLSGGDAAARARITLAFDGAGFACQVGNDRVLCLHGNEVDTWNVTDYEALRRVIVTHTQKLSAVAWTPNAGTKLVIDVMNEIKRDHAFVDILKPQNEAVLRVLYALRPSLDSKLQSIAGIAARRVWDGIRRTLRFLSSQSEERPNETALLGRAGDAAWIASDTGDLLRRVENQLNDKVDPLLLVERKRDSRLGWGSEFVSGFFGTEPYVAAWEGMKELVHDSTFDIRRTDSDYDRIDALAGQDYRFVIAGHTHLARILARRNGSGMYYNTGTWAALMRITPAQLESAKIFEPVFDRMKSAKTIEALGSDLVFTRPTVAFVRHSGGQTDSALKKVTLQSGSIALVDTGDDA